MTDPKPTVTIPLDVAEQIAWPLTESQRRRAVARLTDAIRETQAITSTADARASDRVTPADDGEFL